MKIPAIFQRLTHQKPKIENIYALEIENDSAKVALWCLKDGKTDILKIAQAHFHETSLGMQGLIVKLLREVSTEEKAGRIVFGLPSDWITEDRIKEPYLEELRKLCQAENLKAAGFATTEETIIHELRRREGTPPSAILVRIGLNSLSVVLVEAGNVKHARTITIENTDSTTTSEHVASILAGFAKGETLPSRFILYDNNENLEKEKQDLISYPWMQRFPFLHFPNVETLEDNFDIKALVFASARESYQKIKTEQETIAVSNRDEDQGKTPPEVINASSAATDIVEKQENLSLSTPEDLGFFKGAPGKESPSSYSEVREQPFQSKDVEEKERDFGRTPWGLIKERLALPKFSIPSFSFRLTLPVKKLKIGGIVLVLISIGVTAAFFWFLPQAEVKLYVNSRVLEEEIEITVDPNSKTIDLERAVIPGLVVETTEEGSRKGVTTGKKTVGDKAKGEITIYNKTQNDKTFTTQNLLFGANNLVFTLDNDVTVSSASAGVESTIYGKTKTKITAQEIGSKSNLPADSDFRFKDFPETSYSARNENALTGGTSREVSVVTKEDEERLLATLSSELKNRGEESLKTKTTGNEKIVAQSTVSQVAEKNYDKDVNEEGKELSLNLKVVTKALAFNQNDLTNLVTQKISPLVPEGYRLSDDSPGEPLIKTGTNKDGSVNLMVHLKTLLVPKIEASEIKRELSGKSLKEAKTYLGKEANIVRYEIKLKPEPPFLKNLPRSPENIRIDVLINE